MASTPTPRPPICLTIAGSDSSGGAGLQADLKTFEAFGTYGASVVTLLTAQNTLGVTAVEHASPAMVRAQLRAVLDDLRVDAIKLGALGNEETMRLVVDALRAFEGPLVIDPVMVSKHGSRLLDDAAATYLATYLLPTARVITPNRAEAAALLVEDVSDDAAWQADAAERLWKRFRVPVLITGGAGLTDDVIDTYADGVDVQSFTLPRLAKGHQHGAGCTLAAAITARLALGDDLAAAIMTARTYVWHAMRDAPDVGHGDGPLWHRAAKRA